MYKMSVIGQFFHLCMMPHPCNTSTGEIGPLYCGPMETSRESEPNVKITLVAKKHPGCQWYCSPSRALPCSAIWNGSKGPQI
jgi:hypothetical protein